MEKSYATHIVHSLPNVLSVQKQGREVVAPRSRFAGNISAIPSSRTPAGSKKYGRNDKVTITNGTETKEVKFKKVESFLAEGWKIVG